jgi:hypothetical protein
MSAFLDEVLVQRQARHRRFRRAGEGLSGSGKRFATLLTFMVGLTAVPTFIMVRAGVEELRSSPAAPVRPILLEVPEKAPPPNKQPLLIEPRKSWALPVIPPNVVVPQRVPILERKAVVDTSPRPIAKKRKAAKARSAAPQKSTSEISIPEPKQRPQKRRHAETPRPERPRVERPERPDVIRPGLIRPQVSKPYRERVARPRS